MCEYVHISVVIFGIVLTLCILKIIIMPHIIQDASSKKNPLSDDQIDPNVSSMLSYYS